MTANPEPGARGDRGGPPIADPNAPDYYQLLGVDPTASAAEITRAYRAAMKHTHPDRHSPERRAVAEDRAKRLNQVYATLSNPSRRLAYDRSIRTARVQDELMNHYVGGFVPMHQRETDIFGEQMRRERTPAEQREQAVADRSAAVSLLLVFLALALALVFLIVVWSVIAAALGTIV